MRIPRAGRWCFVIAFVNAAIWTVVVPPFQIPDEISHFAYAQYLAEKGKPPPQGPGAQYSPQEQETLNKLDFFQVIGRPYARGIISPSEDRSLREATRGLTPVGEGGASAATSQPPLYYALEVIPYWLSPSHEILARLALMRLLSALLAAVTVLGVFLFMREAMPGTPWAWTVGALVGAFQPTFDFIASGVHGDNLLFTASAWTFFLLMRAYRRGLTRGLAAGIGAVVAVGLLSKLTYIALVPGIALALLLLAWRTLPAGRAEALRRLLIAVAIAAVPVAIYAILNLAVWGRGSPTAGGVAGATNSALPGGGTVTMHETLDYIWQLYLPRLPFMHHVFFGSYPLWNVWLIGVVGHFGWLDYVFPPWVYQFAKVLFIVLAVLAPVATVRLHSRIRPLLPICGCFAVMAIGLLAAIGYSGIRYRLSTGFQFEQGRYLFPLLALYGLFVVLAARSLPRRWAPLLGGALVLLAMTHGLFAETLTISRYYG